MALSFTNLGSSATPDLDSNTDAASYVTSSWTPPTSGIILVWIVSGEGSGNARVNSVTGNSLTWKKVGEVGYGGDVPGRRITLFAAWATGATTGATTIDFGGVTQLFCTAMFMQVTGSFTVSDVLDAFPQGSSGFGNGVSGTFDMSNPSASSASRCAACFSHNVNEAVTARTNWTAADGFNGSGPVRGSQSQFRSDAYEATASASWTTSGLWGGLSVEINESGATTPPTGSGEIGGVFPETPGFMGPIVDGNGNLYTVTEFIPLLSGTDASSDARPAIRKSSDQGVTWIEVDGLNRPHYNDIESLWLEQDGTKVHVLWQRSLNQVFYSQFNTSDAVSNPDKWVVTDEIASPEPAAPANEQTCSIAQLSNGTIYAFYCTNDGTQDCIGYRTRTGLGSWSAESTIVVAGHELSAVITVVDASDEIHIFVTDHTAPALLYYTLPSGGSLSGSTTIASGTDVSSSAGDTALVVSVPQLTSSGVYVVWINNSSVLVGCEIVSGTPGSIQTVSDVAVDSNPGATTSAGPGAALAKNGSELHLIYVRESDEDLSRDEWTGAWGTDISIATGVTIYYVEGAIFTRGSNIIFGYIWGDGTDLQGTNNDPSVHYSEIVVGSVPPQVSTNEFIYVHRSGRGAGW